MTLQTAARILSTLCDSAEKEISQGKLGPARRLIRRLPDPDRPIRGHPCTCPGSPCEFCAHRPRCRHVQAWLARLGRHQELPR
jgi:hypothetical protein